MKEIIKYKEFEIEVTAHNTRFGVLYHAENNIGEPYDDFMAYKTKKEAVDIEKANIDIYLEETSGDYKKQGK